MAVGPPPCRRSGGLLPEHVMETLDLVVVPRAGPAPPATRKDRIAVDVLHERAAALDIGKRDLKACVRSAHLSRAHVRHSEVRTFATTTNSLLQLRDWLVGERGAIVGMGAPGDFWRPPFYLLEDVLNVVLVNAAHAKNLPGHKSDVADAVWLAQLAECGLLRASFVPPEPIRQLRDLTRYRTTLLTERSREAKRLEKELEDAGIKLSSVATDILGVSGRLMLQALIDGERDPAVLADLAKARMRRRMPDLSEALVGNCGEHHAFPCRLHLQRIDQITASVTELSSRISEAMAPFREQLKLLDGIPGIGPGVAETIIAETGGDMSRLPTAAHLASWAGVCPGRNESAGRDRPGRTRHGNRWRTGALGAAAMAAAGTEDSTFSGARYRRLSGRLGRLEAV